MLSTRSVRFRLLLAVNAAMGVLLLLFLVLDYHRELSDRVAEKRVALEEEAQTLLPGVLRVRPQGILAVQDYVDSVCGTMRDRHSPGHHIAVRMGETALQAVAHHRASPEMLETMETAATRPSREAEFAGETIVVGVSSGDDTTVYVSEQLTNVQRAVRWQIVPRLAGIVLVAVVAAGIINLVFLKMVVRPLRQLVSTVERIGRGELGARSGNFASEEFTVLAEAIDSMSASLAAEDQRRRSEMAKARQIQENLLPADQDVPGATTAFFYQPATEVAGDYYDVIRLCDGSWLFALADVTGHGVPAAMSAAMLKASLLHAAEQHVRLDDILRFVNERFCAVSLTEDFASMLLIRWIPESQTVEYGSAGHETAQLISKDGTQQELGSTGMLLGLDERASWDTDRLEVSAGDRLLMVTDGVAEATNAEGTLFGRQRVAEVLAACRGSTVSEALEQMREAVSIHLGSSAPTDDATLILVEFVESPTSTVGPRQD